MIYVLCVALSLSFNPPSDIVIQLKDEVIENSQRSIISRESQAMKSDDGRDFLRFSIDQPLATCVNGLEYFKDKYNYTSHMPIHVDVYDEYDIRIGFDDNGDGNFDDRPVIQTAINAKTSTTLLFNHQRNEDRNLRVECVFEVVKELNSFWLLIYFPTKSHGNITINDQSFQFSLWKSLNDFGLTVDKEKIVANNPIQIDGLYYYIKEYDPVDNILILTLADPTEKLYGIAVDMHVREQAFEKALSFHHIDALELTKKKYHLFHFWGDWCPDCLSEMDRTKRLLNDIGDNVEIYHIAYIGIKNDGELEEIQNLAQSYDLPGHHLTEWRSEHTKDTSPFIHLFGNKSYPNIVIVDSELKILYLSESSGITVQNFLETLR